MRKRLLYLFTSAFGMFMLTCGAAIAASGPQTAWSVFTLPNPQVTPNWRSYAPVDCLSNADACAGDHRFREEWDLSNFQTAIDASFAAVSTLGKFQGVMLNLPLGDTPAYWNNIQLMYQSAASHGVLLQVVLFPKWKYGSEYCYLYNNGAPSGCQLVLGTTSALAYQKVLNLKNFWQSLPISTCNLQASYITWLDSGFAGNSDVQQLQKYVVKRRHQTYWVNTELYSTSQIQQYLSTYKPYQTIISGNWGAADSTSWAQGMCAVWNVASQPTRLGVWTFYDRDVSPIEEYRGYINGSMAVVGSICSY